MRATVLNYRIIVEPDQEAGTGRPGYTALCPTLGVADDGRTIEEALDNVRGAIDAYVQSLVEDGLPIPKDEPEHDFVTTAQITLYQRPVCTGTLRAILRQADIAPAEFLELI